MFGEDEKVWQAIWRITTGKYLPVLSFLITYLPTAGVIGRVFCAR